MATDIFTISTSEVLDHSNPSSLPEALNVVRIGEIIAGLIPRWVVKSSLASSATQIHVDSTTPTAKRQPFIVLAVTDAADAHLDIVAAGAGAGKVVVAYDTDGVPTFTFSAAVTGYKVLGCPLPKKLGERLENKLNFKPAAYP